MLLKLSVLALTLAVASAAQCGSPAIRPGQGILEDIKNVLTGKTSGRIVGGVEAKAHSWPWQIVLLVNGQFQCGGSIINENYVMTAAHCCAITSNPASFTVRVGAHNRVASEPSQANHVVAKKIQHPQYGSVPSTNNDFCLLKLATPIQFNDKVSPVCLADATDGPVGQKCYVTGFGRQTGGSLPNNLQEADVSIISNDACHKAWSPLGAGITAQQVCIADPYKGSCNGDSGGPLVCEDAAGLYKLVGVVSWGHRTCGAAPGVYARTSSALDWIATSIANN
jgi:secreted trypsin-like serine protease